MACPFFQPVEVPQALQVGALLASQHALEVAVRDGSREKEFHVDVLVQLRGPGVRLGEPLVERLMALGRKLVEQLSAIAARTNGPDEPVALKALERRVDLADIDVPGPTKHGFKAVFHLISVERLSLQEPQHAVLKRQSVDLTYSVCMLSMHGGAARCQVPARVVARAFSGRSTTGSGVALESIARLRCQTGRYQVVFRIDDRG